VERGLAIVGLAIADGGRNGEHGLCRQPLEHRGKAGTTIFLVEQNAYAALGIADRGYVLETGSVVLSDTGKALLNDQKVKEAYLGL